MLYPRGMDHRTRYQALADFLLEYQDIWRNEIMLEYPTPVRAYDPAWVEELLGHTSPEATWRLAQGEGWQDLQAPGLAAFHSHLTALSTFPAPAEVPPLPVQKQTWVHVVPKKQHELERLAPLLARLARARGLTRIVDIGGGQGHLAQTLAHHYRLDVLSLDMDPELQAIGRRWQKAKWPDSPHPVEFRPHKITRHDAGFKATLDAHTLSTGLHTCGGLAVAHLEATCASGATVANLACCYHKLEVGEWNLSGATPLPFNQFALTLASGAHRKVTLEDIRFRNQLKHHRYTLHFLLHDEYGRSEQVTLGNCPPELYAGPFPAYAREQFSRLGIPCDWSDGRLETYFTDETRVKLIHRMLAAAIIRDSLGRALEAAILCDRALWLEGQGYDVAIQEVFDPTASPRNLALLGAPRE